MSLSGSMYDKQQPTDLLKPVAVRMEDVRTGAGCDEELACLEAASADSPLDPTIHVKRGLLLCRLGRHQEAIDALEAASGMAPD